MKNRNLHIIPYEKFTNGYIAAMNEHYGSSANMFCVLAQDLEAKVNFPNVHMIYATAHQDRDIISEVKKSKNIFLHNISYLPLKVMLYLSCIRNRNQFWVLWGMDLYSYQDRAKNWKTRVREFIRRRFIRNLHAIVFWVRGDYDLACQWYGTNARYFRGGYPIGMELVEACRSAPRSSSDRITRIQVGNSASKRNKHLQALEKLRILAAENVEIYCPLSYAGPKEYVDKVVSRGKEIFGDKFIPLLDMMPKAEYVQYLDSIDIGIFNTDRQMGLGNILLLLALGKKVYINDDTTPWDFLQEIGIMAFAFNKDLSAEGILDPLTETQKYENYLGTKTFSDDFFRYWDDIFAECE